ncbi:MAG: formate--tetrahydrofolate ligase [Chitinispirillaceae bacterium]|nr:formate--tetrahydrofolate ligase [Chitinispirillaceae bacterium]
MKTDLDIAREAQPKPINEIAAGIGLTPEDIIPYGHLIAKLPIRLQKTIADRPDGRLILVTAMTPTPKGEGKTTTTIGLGQALSAIGKKTMIAIREPSLGPCFGVKGGAAGGGYSQVLPMEAINFHFTGDLHAVTMAHNLLAAVVDNHLHQKNEPQLNPRKVAWKRAIDMNDRSLRNVIVGLQGQGTNGVMREEGFEITAASEVMAVFCLADNLNNLKERLGRIIVGYNDLSQPVTASNLGVHGAMTALLKDALAPNLVQSIEGTPVLVHGGPFANIAHGCNTLIATLMALKLADYVVTEAGFGADLGAEKFFDIKCRIGNLTPAITVMVVTRRAIALHGIENVKKHVENMGLFNIPVVVSINRFADDSREDLTDIQRKLNGLDIPAVITDYRESGGNGGLDLAELVCRRCDVPARFSFLYDLEQPLEQKVRTIAGRMYGAAGIELSSAAKRDFERLETLGFGNLPVCIAKTPASLSDNPKLAGRPSGFTVTVTGAKVSAGAGFVVVYTGEIMTMPGLPRKPAALSIDIDDAGNITGLF